MKKLVVLISVAILVVAGVQAEQWSSFETDPMTDEVIGMAVCVDKDYEGAMFVRNTGLEVEVAFYDSTEYIGGNEITDILYRFGSDDPKLVVGSLSTNGNAVFLHWKEIPSFITKLKGSSRLAIRLWDYNDTAIDIMLDTTGYDKLLSEIGL